MGARIARPVLLGIVGDSAAGKTTLTEGIARILGEDQVLAFCADDYHRESRAERRCSGRTALDPGCNYVDILEQHLRLLRDGQPVLKPVYDHRSGTPERPAYVEPRPYVVVEGLLPYHTRGMRDCFDVKVFLEPDEDLRRRWKLQRDCARRGYTQEEVEAELEQRKADSIGFIQPQRAFADIVVSFRPPEDDSAETGAHLDVRHLLRPTLPHPDLSPLIDGSGRNGLALELSRDRDGKPVDALEISGAIDDRAASSLESLFWEMLPEARHLRGQRVGAFTDGEGRERISHPLALTQLMLTYHTLKAAHGVHAV
jgi:phosphoribulokinase